MLTVIAPGLTISTVNRLTFEIFLPDLDGNAEGEKALADHVVSFVPAGLDAVAEDNAE